MGHGYYASIPKLGGGGTLFNTFRRRQSSGIHKLGNFTSAVGLFIEINFLILMLKSEQLGDF